MNIALLFFGIASISNVSGAEKVFVEMANRFSERGATVYTIWNDSPGVVPYYPFNSQVKQVNLGFGKIKAPVSYKVLREISKGLHLNIKNRVDQYRTDKLCQAIRKQINLSKIDVMICYEFNSIMVANQLSQEKIPVVAMCHNSVEDQIASLTTLQRKEASKVTAYQVLMPSFVDKAKKFLNTDIYCIPNVVKTIPDSFVADLSLCKKIYRIIMIGRIDCHQKRPLIAIRAFLKNASRFSNWQLHFYGPITDSEYKQKIDEYIKVHDLHHQVIYEGITDMPLNVLHDADIFAFPSAYEGFGLALAEANSVGLPAVGFAAAPAVNELIEDKVTGFLATDEDDFARKLTLLMDNRALRVQMGKAAREAMKTYSPDVVWGQWEELLQKVVHKRIDE
ncbi:glycosyltransferase [Megasphaera sp. SC8-1]|uniref:glycosyltransferase n=1 Tax=Megasphaera sp. SC8-1 TaxID=2965102 RepID=UPI00210CE511|nr:glycosyltransferase [Megasphaera sp. SC8-1]MCQ4113591.1 glycosyltransferase [Megasphaera sp. SC8-1]